jgi:nicotinamidase-related amidase
VEQATRSTRVVLLIDVIQAFDGEDGDRLHERLVPIVPAIARLRRQARAARVPVVYVNDHFGRWRSSWEATVAHAVRSSLGDAARRLKPAADDFFVVKPGRSAFHQTPLEALLDTMGARELVIAGLTSDMCVLSAAHDASLRKLRCRVPADTCTALDDERHERALALLSTSMKVDTRPATSLAWRTP